MGARGVIGAGSALAAVMAALVASAEPIPAIDVQLFQFQPGAVVVSAGTTVTWTIFAAVNETTVNRAVNSTEHSTHERSES
jgi:plastocyanin